MPRVTDTHSRLVYGFSIKRIMIIHRNTKKKPTSEHFDSMAALSHKRIMIILSSWQPRKTVLLVRNKHIHDTSVTSTTTENKRHWPLYTYILEWVFFCRRCYIVCVSLNAYIIITLLCKYNTLTVISLIDSIDTYTELQTTILKVSITVQIWMQNALFF